jgi:PPOX class probable F420-dependent enzyme
MINLALYYSYSARFFMGDTATMSTQITRSVLQTLYNAEYVNLTTFRKNGTPVATPVWGAPHNGTIYVETSAEFGKVKRIKYTPRVTLTPCTFRGQATGRTIEGKARIVTDVSEIYIAKGALHRKYGIKRQVIYFIMELIRLVRRETESQDAFIAIEPIKPE